MPQASDEQRFRWGGEDGIGEDKAIAYLQACGYVLRRNWTWIPPSPWHHPSPSELDALWFLIDEWDFGGVIT